MIPKEKGQKGAVKSGERKCGIAWSIVVLWGWVNIPCEGKGSPIYPFCKAELTFCAMTKEIGCHKKQAAVLEVYRIIHRSI